MPIDPSARAEQERYYDHRYGSTSYMEEWPREKQDRVVGIIEALGLAPGARVLDFGCGVGLFAHALQAAMPGIEVHGSDLSAAAIERGQELYPDIRFHRFPGRDAEPPGRFDLVFTHHVLEHVPDIDETVGLVAGLVEPRGAVLHILPCANPSFRRRLARLVRDGIGEDGRYYLEDPAHLRRLSSAQLTQISRRHGLELERALFGKHFWGEIESLTGYGYESLVRWLDPRIGRNALARGRLLALLVLLLGLSLLREKPQHVTRSWREPRSPARRAAFLAALPFAAVTAPLGNRLDRALREAADREWERRKNDPRGSEMFLVFRRPAGR